jgi:hypothetical protein
MAMPMTPDPSAASCKRRDAVVESPASSATTAPSGPCRNPCSEEAALVSFDPDGSSPSIIQVSSHLA